MQTKKNPKSSIVTIIVLTIIAVTLCFGLYWFFFQSNYAARSFGGVQKVHIPKGEKLIGASWKNNSIWYTSRAMKKDETPDTIYYREASAKGILEGKVIFYESK